MAAKRQIISSGSPWEPLVGYSRAIRVGDTVYVSGTTGTDEQGKPVGDLSAQSRHALDKIQRALDQAGATLFDVVQTRIYVTDISRWEDVGRVHAEFFRDVRPASTMVEVSRLIGDGIEVEIEALAVVSR